MNGEISPPNDVPEPRKKVYRADPSLLLKFLGLKETGAYLGEMLGNPKIKVMLDINKLLGHHIAVLGVTGSGKSYTVGVIMEELLDRNIPIVVMDPHGYMRDRNNLFLSITCHDQCLTLIDLVLVYV